jgi:hypothetical protein
VPPRRRPILSGGSLTESVTDAVSESLTESLTECIHNHIHIHNNRGARSMTQPHNSGGSPVTATHDPTERSMSKTTSITIDRTTLNKLRKVRDHINREYPEGQGYCYDDVIRDLVACWVEHETVGVWRE